MTFIVTSCNNQEEHHLYDKILIYLLILDIKSIQIGSTTKSAQNILEPLPLQPQWLQSLKQVYKVRSHKTINIDATPPSPYYL